MGITELDDSQMERIYLRIMEVADAKKVVTDEDIITLAGEEISQEQVTYELDYFHTVTGNHTVPTAYVRLNKGDEVLEDTSLGDGPVNAIYAALDKAMGVRHTLIEYGLKAVGGGKDALGEVTVHLSDGKNSAMGRGVSTDVLEASARAYISAVNAMVWNSDRAGRRKSMKKRVVKKGKKK